MLWILTVLVILGVLGVFALLRSGTSASDPTPDEIARTITDFIDGTGGDWDWDDFTSCPLRDPALDKIRLECNEADTDITKLKAIRDRITQQT